MEIEDKAIDALGLSANFDDPTTIRLDDALRVALALIQEAQVEAWSFGFFAAIDCLPEGSPWYPAWENEPNPYNDKSES